MLNMIVHRDYTVSADSIIKIFSNYILFFNPGMLPNSITLDQLLTNNYVSLPRNKQIAKIVKDLGWILENNNKKYGVKIKNETILEIKNISKKQLNSPQNTKNSELLRVLRGEKKTDA